MTNESVSPINQIQTENKLENNPIKDTGQDKTDLSKMSREELVNDPRVLSALYIAGIKDPSIHNQNLPEERVKTETFNLSPDELLDMVQRHNPHLFRYDQLPEDSPLTTLEWLKWKHNGTYEYPEQITPEMLQRAMYVANKIGINVSDLSPAQIQELEGLTSDDNIEHLKKVREHLYNFSDDEKEETTSESQDDLLPSGKKVTWLREGAQFDENGNFHLGKTISSRMSRPHSQPLYKSNKTPETNCIYFGIHIPDDIEEKARSDANNITKEGFTDTDLTYLEYIAKSLGWLRDLDGDWIIPKEQIELISQSDYDKLMTRL